MSVFRVMNIFQGASGESKDVYVNTFHFIHADPATAEDVEALAFKMVDFYVLKTPVANYSITDCMSGTALGAGFRQKIYDLSDPPIRTARYDIIQTLALRSDHSGTNLPSETAICMSFAANPIAGVPETRRRGRIYLGPLNTSVIEPSSGEMLEPARVRTWVPGMVTEAATRLATAAIAAGWTWVVYSQRNNMSYSISRVWCDNAFDTQRRRGEEATSRSIVEGPPFAP